MAAEALLRRAGYRIVARQARAVLRVAVDGRIEEFEVRADLVVRRWWRRYVAEIKSGGAARLAHAPTRRQLLEYRQAFACKRLLLVDADRGRILRVSF